MKKSKILALYLPQFHEIKENNEWWGSGYTEWYAVKNAEPLYDGHCQPVVPLNNNYYNLLNKETMQWQAELMHKYKIDGMCFYHYYFENGKKLLEKPAENLLIWKDIDMPFCFCWANETWSRTWEKFSRENVWSSKYEKSRKFGDKSILIYQKYGRERLWKEHIDYLLDFFKDDRYIKIDNKPVFVIYKPLNICSYDAMKEYFEMEVIAAGFNGIYWIDNINNTNEDVEKLSGTKLFRQPTIAFDSLMGKKNIFNDCPAYSCDYFEFYNEIINQTAMMQEQDLFCVPVGFDSTPRNGKYGAVIKGNSLNQFSELLELMYTLSCCRDHELMFINAWNEWGEGMILEPTENNRFGYLESIKSVAERNEMELLSYYEKYKDVITEISKKTNENIKKSRSNDVTERSLRRRLRLFEQWKTIDCHDINVGQYLQENGYASIAIYGGGELCKYLMMDFEKIKIDVQYIIDKKGFSFITDKPVYSLEDTLPYVDVIIVTIYSDFDNIYKTLRKKSINCAIISIEEVISEMLP